jgi:hypothetical protein
MGRAELELREMGVEGSFTVRGSPFAVRRSRFTVRRAGQLGPDGASAYRSRRNHSRSYNANTPTATRRHADTPTHRHTDTPTHRHTDTPHAPRPHVPTSPRFPRTRWTT